MSAWQSVSDLLHAAPDLPGAACTGHWELFDSTINLNTVEDRPTKQELEYARAEAPLLCKSCEALRSCRAYLNGRRPSQRPPGVIAGQIITTSGRTLTTTADACCCEETR
jgi:hypothetical protein